MKLQLPRGMRDFAPAEKLLRDGVLATLKATFERYGFNPLETPIVERWETLAAKYGGGEEILKETYKLTDQGGRQLGLRYDLTTPLARFVGMNPSVKKPFKRYHVGLVYRDGPLKKGRYREFYQCDVDTVGSASMLADAECVLLALDVFEQLGFDVEVRVNNRRLLFALAKRFLGTKDDESALGFVLSLDKLEKVGRDGVTKELREKGFAQDLDELWSLVELDEAPRDALARLREALDESGGWLQDLEALFALLGPQRRVRFVPSLARGLGYYTGTVFEVFMADGSFHGALAAGGRYDNLIGDFLGAKEPVPAVGISFGLEPIVELLKARTPLADQPKTTVRAYLVPVVPDQTTAGCFEMLSKLRAAGVHADMDLMGRGPSANFKYANAYGVPFVIVLGPDELAAGQVTLKDMGSGEEARLGFDEAVARLTAL